MSTWRKGFLALCVSLTLCVGMTPLSALAATPQKESSPAEVNATQPADEMSNDTKATSDAADTQSIEAATIEPLKEVTYTGGAAEPSPKVKFSGKTLAEGTDYTVSYKNNTEVGVATVSITGKGSFTGTKATTFNIVAASISKATVSEINTQKWTGKAVKPKVTVTLDGRTLKEGSDYVLSYDNNVKPETTATVTVTGKGNYKGVKDVKFKIGPKAAEWKAYGNDWRYEYPDGTYTKSQFASIDGKWYYFDGSGYLVTGWFSDKGKWYYAGSDGVMVTGWQHIDGADYYFEPSGVMTSNKWVGDYYLGSDGVMLTDAETPDGYWVGSDGKYVTRSMSVTSSETVYWTPNGEVYHSTANCRTLSRSKTIYSGTIEESGKARGCKVCY